MLFKKIGGILQILFSLALGGVSFYLLTEVRLKVKTTLLEVATLENTLREKNLEFIMSLVESGLPSIIVMVFGIVFALIALLFVIQGVINVLPDHAAEKKSSSETITFDETKKLKKENKPASDSELGDEY